MTFDEDHPRRCGENRRFEVRKPRRRGSPPQVRGKLQSFSMFQVSYRITPAGAGKTSSASTFRLAQQDHPRRCGENLFFGRGSRTPAGSPPQVRGKPALTNAVYTADRITPAGAGKTKTPTSAVLLARDHPRRCGENRQSAGRGLREMGSPPQVRGKPP